MIKAEEDLPGTEWGRGRMREKVGEGDRGEK
jgi:hypothetical protein